jgi:hypothetical protein
MWLLDTRKEITVDLSIPYEWDEPYYKAVGEDDED